MRKLFIGLLLVLVGLGSAAVASGQAGVILDKGRGSSVLEHRVYRGTGDSEVPLGRALGPGVWRVSYGVGRDTSAQTPPLRLTIDDSEGPCYGLGESNSPLLIIGRANGGFCRGGDMTMSTQASHDRRDQVSCSTLIGTPPELRSASLGPKCWDENGTFMHDGNYYVDSVEQFSWVVVFERLARAS